MNLTRNSTPKGGVMKSIDDTDLSDLSILTLSAQSGHHPSKTKLYLVTEEKIRLTAKNLCWKGDADISYSEDIAQEAWCYFYDQKKSRFNSEKGDFYEYFYGLLRNAAKKVLRRNNTYSNTVSEHGSEQSGPSISILSPDNTFEDNHSDSVVRLILGDKSKLPAEDKQLLKLKVLDEHTDGEIAGITEISRHMVGRKFSKLQATLATKYSDLLAA